MGTLEEAKARIDAVVDEHSEALIGASRSIHAHPELGFVEHHAHDLLTDLLEGAGLAVTRGAYGLPTAFEARRGAGGPVIAVLCEYDALPGIGHACGHNVIAAAGAGAGIAAATVAADLGGTIVVLGTPAEEGGGGKIFMAEAGALDGIDAALMVHPAGLDLTRLDTLAIQQLDVTYRGKAAHAAASPHTGHNALDAAVLGYVNVAALRQHIHPDERVHGIFTEAGDAANVVPERAAATWYVRSPTVGGLGELKARVLACLAAGASATGCEMDHHWNEAAFANMVDNRELIGLYSANLGRVGREITDPDPDTVVGSTDMGNVSHVVPSIHPMIAVAPPTVSIHTQDFVKYAGGHQGDQAVLDAAKAMAHTVADLWADEGVLGRVKAEFELARAQGRATGRARL